MLCSVAAVLEGGILEISSTVSHLPFIQPPPTGATWKVGRGMRTYYYCHYAEHTRSAIDRPRLSGRLTIPFPPNTCTA